jgi:hypothetical protein
MTRTPILPTRQNWHNYLPNKSIASVFFRMDRSSFYITLSVAWHVVTYHTAFQSSVFRCNRLAETINVDPICVILSSLVSKVEKPSSLRLEPEIDFWTWWPCSCELPAEKCYCRCSFIVRCFLATEMFTGTRTDDMLSEMRPK